jgi:metal-responsive CopG/Arc/MetJ family transcriptional regulator
MKTAISVPDAVFDRVERYVADHGLSRSQFYASAAEHYLTQMRAVETTARIDAAIGTAASDPDQDEWAEVGRAALAGQCVGDEW